MENKYLVFVPKFQGNNKIILSVKDISNNKNIIYFYNGAIKYNGINNLENYDIINDDDINKVDLPVDNVDFDMVKDKVVVIKK
jgi:competence protein ComEC